MGFGIAGKAFRFSGLGICGRLVTGVWEGPLKTPAQGWLAERVASPTDEKGPQGGGSNRSAKTRREIRGFLGRADFGSAAQSEGDTV
jgi:hypothetical protein